MIKKFFLLVLGLLIVVHSNGCTNGPVRYKTLGYYKYATTEFQTDSHPALKPIVIMIGIPIDATLVMLDTGVNVVAGIPLTFTHGGPDADGINLKEQPWNIIFIPFWYPFTVVALGVWPQDMYQEIFGCESTMFK